MSDFNSKMVRLKVGLIGGAAKGNFHFNSKMVRLKGGHRSHLGTNTIISIPKWYD